MIRLFETIFLSASPRSMRTMLMPIGAGLFGLANGVIARRFSGEVPRRTIATVVVAAMVAFVAGHVVYGAIFVAPLRYINNPEVSDYAYHTFAHPLPKEMALVYVGKLRALGDGVFDSVGSVFGQFGIPEIVPVTFGRMTNGVVLLGIAIGAFVYSFRRGLVTGDVRSARRHNA